MNILDLLFGTTGSALVTIFEINYIPAKEDFLELTTEQYAQFNEKMGKTDQRVYIFAPADPHFLPADDYNEITIATESDVQGFMEAAKMIDNYCADQHLQTTTEKLRYVASCLPDAFTKGTRYEKYHHLAIVKKPDQEKGI